MGIYEYNILPGEKQWNTLRDKGKFLANLKVTDKSFSLCAIDKFFVEVTYDANDNRITDINSFMGGETLDKYSNVPREI